MITARQTRSHLLCSLTILVMAALASPAPAVEAPASFDALAKEYSATVHPILKRYCLNCHSTERQKGDLDLERFTTLEEVRTGTKAWIKVVEMLDLNEMPPEDSKQPTAKEFKQIRGWTERYLDAEALANAGDPGPVVLRRLNNSEYTFTVQDLTAVALEPAQEFPDDNAAGEGFTNAGNAMAMSPALLSKYLDAANEIVSHAVLYPNGFRFSPSNSQRDWTDEALAHIRNFYSQFVATENFGVGGGVGNLNVHRNTRIGNAGRLPLEAYFTATVNERRNVMAGTKTIDSVADDYRLNRRYLRSLWSGLASFTSSLLLDDLRSRWHNAKTEDPALLAAHVAQWQKGLWMFGPVGLIGRVGGPSRWMEPVNPVVSEQTVRLTFSAEEEKKDEDSNDDYVVLSLVVGDAGDGNDDDMVLLYQPRLVSPDRPEILLRDLRHASLTPSADEESQPKEEWGLDPELFGQRPDGRAIDAGSLCLQAPTVLTFKIPKALATGRELVTKATLDPETGGEGSVQVEFVEGTALAGSGLLPSEAIVTFSRVTQVFSDRRDLAYRRPLLVRDGSAAHKRVLAAFEDFRALFPAALCYSQIVPVDEVLTLTLWYREDDHLARLMLDDRQKTQLDQLWADLHYVSHSPVAHLETLELLLEVMTGNYQYYAIAPLEEPYREAAAAFRAQLVADEPRQVDALVEFAAQAYRRPVTNEEGDELRSLYRRLREQELSHDEAFRLTLARIFVASPFLYRLENKPASDKAAAVSDWELASRLSYFLWSSQPDDELRVAAAAGALSRPETLMHHMRRLLRDDRVRRLADQFACQWLHVYDFDVLTEKSEKHFPEFVELRGDMYEESIRFFTDLFQRDRSLLGLLNADYTFANERLAKFYGIDDVKGPDWQRVDNLSTHGRGGVLGMAAALAKQSGASRTSPILRGNWVSEVLLGEKLPRPPQNVPELPADETATDGLTVRELVAKHATEPLCARCHQRIDPLGFALEGFDTIGRRRDQDLAGRAIDTATTLADGSQINGLPGLRDYLLTTRRDTFLYQFCRKLLGYALGREVQLSDEPLLSEITEALAKNDYRFSVAVEKIVLSTQFRMIRPSE